MVPLGYGAQLVTRAEWGARPPRSTVRLSVDKVTSHWEGPHMGSFPHSQCAGKVRGIQNFHMDSNGWSDIAYNAVACPHRYVFEGRGRGVRSAANGTEAGNSGAYAVCYLGGVADTFPEDGKAAMKAAGDWLTRPGSARNNHRDWKATQCPGNEIAGWTNTGQPVSWNPPPPTTDQKVIMDTTYMLVKGDVEPWYWLVHGETRSLLYGFDVVDAVSHSLNDTSWRIYAARLGAQGLEWRGGEQFYCYNGLDAGGHANPFVWHQALVDRLVRTDLPV